MKKFENHILKEVFCNKCGKQIEVENGMLREDCFEVNRTFGYFSHKDGETQTWDLCEDCYDRFVRSFQIPVTSKEETELI